MSIPFVDLRAQFHDIRAEVVPRMIGVMESAAFILGPDVALFEENFATYVGSRYCVGVEIHYPIPIHLQPAYADMRLGRGSFERTERSADRLLSLPMYAELSEVQIDAVVGALASCSRMVVA